MRRDFTYVDDLVDAIRSLMDVVPRHPAIPVKGDSLSPTAPWRVVNIGNGEPVALTDFISALQAAAGRRARLRMLPMQPGDVEATWADTSLLRRLIGPPPPAPRWPWACNATGTGSPAITGWPKPRHRMRGF